MPDPSVISRLATARKKAGNYIDVMFSGVMDNLDVRLPSCIATLKTYPPILLVMLWSLFSFISGLLCKILLHQLLDAGSGNDRSGVWWEFIFGLLDKLELFFWSSTFALGFVFVVWIITGSSRRCFFFLCIGMLISCAVAIILIPFILWAMSHVLLLRYLGGAISKSYREVVNELAKYHPVKFLVSSILISAAMGTIAFKCASLRLQILRRKNSDSEAKGESEVNFNDFTLQFLISLVLYFFATGFAGIFFLTSVAFHIRREIIFSSFLTTQILIVMFTASIFLRNILSKGDEA